MPKAAGALTVLIPGLSSDLVLSAISESGRSPAAIRRRLRQASKRRLESTAAHVAVFDAFDLQSNQSVAPYQALGAFGKDKAAGEWMRADPILLHPDRDHLLVFDHSSLTIRLDEAEALVASLNETYRDDGWVFHVITASQWLLQLPACYQFGVRDLFEITGQSFMVHLPTGADAGLLINRLNEIQMLFHAHSVNVSRQAEDQPGISGVWLSGLGRLPESIPRRFDRVVSNDALLRGLARSSGVEPTCLPDEIGDDFIPLCEGHTLIDLSQEGETQSQTFIQWVMNAFLQQRCSQLTVYLGDGCVYCLKPWQSLKFWVSA